VPFSLFKRSVSMPDVSAERILTIAEAARIAIEPQSAKRVAAAVGPAVNRLTAAKLTIQFEIEPSSFMVAQQREVKR
jgi:hypothetical protein